MIRGLEHFRDTRLRVEDVQPGEEKAAGRPCSRLPEGKPVGFGVISVLFPFFLSSGLLFCLFSMHCSFFSLIYVNGHFKVIIYQLLFCIS